MVLFLHEFEYIERFSNLHQCTFKAYFHIFYLFRTGGLKIVSATFLLVCFLSLNETSCQTRKNVFYFFSKALFVLEKIKFQNFRFSNFMTSSLGSKHSLLMKFGQLMSYCKRNNFIKKFYKNWSQKATSGPFCVSKELSTTSIGKRNF